MKNALKHYKYTDEAFANYSVDANLAMITALNKDDFELADDIKLNIQAMIMNHAYFCTSRKKFKDAIEQGEFYDKAYKLLQEQNEYVFNSILEKHFNDLQ